MRRLGLLALLCGIGLLLALVPTPWLESSHSICVIKNLFGIDCYGCGMTRAISCVFHGELRQAVQYNKLVVLVFPLLVYVAIKGLRREIQR